MKRPLVYIAGPFRAASHWHQEQNIRRAEEIALEVWRAHCAVICPHTNTRFFQGALPDDVWLQGDLVMVERSDALVFTPDWHRSEGAKMEWAHAEKFGIPRFVFPSQWGDFLLWLNGVRGETHDAAPRER